MVQKLPAGQDDVQILYLKTEFNIPVIVSVFFSQTNDVVKFSIGASANLNVESAIVKSLEELFAVYILVYANEKRSNKISDNGIISFDDHVAYYQNLENKNKLFFLDRPLKKINQNSIESVIDLDFLEKLKITRNRIESTGEKILYADITTDDVRQNDLTCVKVFITNALEIEGAHKFARHKSKRLLKFPKYLNPNAEILNESDINTDPHPFP